MLERIEAKPNQFHRYKQPDVPVEPGTYYRTAARLPDLLRRAVGAFAAQTAAGRFCWLIPYECWVRQLLEQWQPDEFAYYGQCDLNHAATVAAVQQRFKLTPDLWGKLRGWQRRLLGDVAVCCKLAGTYRRGEIAPLGSGKTLAGLCVCGTGQRPAVLAPSHVHASWQAEAAKWGLVCPRVSTYESAHKLHPYAPDVLILDEVLAVKNPATQRAAKTLVLSDAAKVVVGFTATPSSVAPYDLRWLRAVRPGSVPCDEITWRHLFGVDTRLEEIPGKPGQKCYVTNVWDIGAVTKFTAPWLGTVPLDEIVGELPAVTYQRLTTPQPARYNLILAGAAADSKAKALAQARQISDGAIYDGNGVAVPMNTAKLDVLAELIESTPEPVVVFAAWDFAVEAAAERFAAESPAVLRGSAGNYTTEIERFRSGATRLLIANARISTGMNLQRCGNRPTRLMVFLSNSLSPVDRTQAEGRIVRPGNTAAGVVIYDVIAAGTLDAATLDALKRHAGQSEAVVLAALEAEFERLRAVQP